VPGLRRQAAQRVLLLLDGVRLRAASVQEILNKQKKISADQSGADGSSRRARGLDYAHKKGIIHRDVKPDNLMIAETGDDQDRRHGPSRAALEEKVGPEEETSVIGTPHYIAPEQVLGRPADFRSDIYSLGRDGLRMLAGRDAFLGAEPCATCVNKKVREDAASIVEHSPEVPKAVAEIVARMMARGPGSPLSGDGRGHHGSRAGTSAARPRR
jgi:serine/threonine-protein kinase